MVETEENFQVEERREEELESRGRKENVLESVKAERDGDRSSMWEV